MHVTGFRRHFRFAGNSETKGLMVTSWHNGALKRDPGEENQGRPKGGAKVK